MTFEDGSFDDGFNGYVIDVDLLFFRFSEGSLQLAVDGDVGILVETGVALESGFGCSTAFDNGEVMLEETDTPFDANRGIVMFEGMCLALGDFDQFAVGYAGFGPMRREMVGIELEETVSHMGITADDDMFTAFATEFEIVHGAPEEFDGSNGSEIAHTSGGRSGKSG